MRGDVLADDAVSERVRNWRELRLTRHPHQVGVAGLAGRRRRFGDLDAIGPLDFERRQSNEQGAGKVALAADAQLSDRLFAGEKSDTLRQLGRRHIVLVHVIGRPGDRGAHAVEGKARDAADAGGAGSQFRPIVGLADAERGDNAHAGDGDDRTACLIARRWACHEPLLHSARVTSASPSPRQLPTLVTTTWDSDGGVAPLSPLPAGANSLPCSSTAEAMPIFAAN